MCFTTPYHPQSNRMIEQFHWALKDALGAQLTDADWLEHLTWVFLALRVAPCKDLGILAAELVYG
jgi:hypothetical protein